VRLAFEATGTPYTDVSNENKDGINAVLAQISSENIGDENNPPPLAPPVLKHGDDITISQTPNILFYLGPKLNLVPNTDEDPIGIYHVNALALTALDGLSNEPHDTHHPIATGDYYEDQKPEALKKAKDYRSNRLPKFLGYFERVLNGSASKGGEYLYGGQLTYADLVFFQCLDGVSFAFPKCTSKMRESGSYDRVFALYDRVKGHEKIKAYLQSDRRQKYSMGIYRHYPELDEDGEIAV
jgi:glutathione S-transferase